MSLNPTTSRVTSSLLLKAVFWSHHTQHRMFSSPFGLLPRCLLFRSFGGLERSQWLRFPPDERQAAAAEVECCDREGHRRQG